jgi:type VI secretion system protein ImpA
LAQLDADIWVRLIPLMPITRDGLTTGDYDQATEMDGLASDAEKNAYRVKGVISSIDFEAKVRDSGSDFLRELVDDARDAQDQFARLTSFLDERCGDDAPASREVEEIFRHTLDLIRDLAEPYLPKEPVSNGSQMATPTVGGAAGGAEKTGPTTSSWNRERAFEEISRQADLFEKYEPNSPVAPMLRQAVRLGNLSWRDMVSMLTDDPSVRAQILRQTGVRDDTADGSQE